MNNSNAQLSALQMSQGTRQEARVRWTLGMILLAVLLVALALPGTTGSLLTVWASSETFNHCFLVLPVALYLIWQQRERISPFPRPNVLWTSLLVPVAAVWFMGRLAGVQLVEHFAFVTSALVLIVALLGGRLASQYALPLLFLYFAVPAGEALIPVMIDFTADFTVSVVRSLGIPVFREGNLFTLPTGRWSVVEACSGVRYLIASLFIGTVYAYLNYIYWWKRAVFILVSIALPIVANGIRAVLIVLIGHFSEMELATGIDHLIYGWLFFGFVIFLLFVIGNKWRDPWETVTQVSAETDSEKTSIASVSLVAGIGFLLLAGTSLWARSLLELEPAPQQSYPLASIIEEIASQSRELKVCEARCEEGVIPVFRDYTLYNSATLVYRGKPLQLTVAGYHSDFEGELINSRNLDFSEASEFSLMTRSVDEVVLGGKSWPVMIKTVRGRKDWMILRIQEIAGQPVLGGAAAKWQEVQIRSSGAPYASTGLVVATPLENNQESTKQFVYQFLMDYGLILNKHLRDATLQAGSSRN